MIPNPVTPGRKTPCQRCGVPTLPDFCLDCRAVDPEFCAAGRTSRQVLSDRQAQNAQYREFNRLMYYLAEHALPYERPPKTRRPARIRLSINDNPPLFPVTTTTTTTTARIPATKDSP